MNKCLKYKNNFIILYWLVFKTSYKLECVAGERVV